jgi:hypothetical protein
MKKGNVTVWLMILIMGVVALSACGGNSDVGVSDAESEAVSETDWGDDEIAEEIVEKISGKIIEKAGEIKSKFKNGDIESSVESDVESVDEVAMESTTESVDEVAMESTTELADEESTESATRATSEIKANEVAESKPIHTHSWDEGTVTQAATCVSDGIIVYTCGCGETKTEAINALGHNWVAQTTVVHHDAEGVYTKNRVGTQRVIYCNCGEVFYSDADRRAHDPNNFHGYSVWDEPTYETGWFEISPAWDETVTTGYVCSVCGVTQ